VAKVFFTDNGSSAIEASLKMAIQYWKNKGREGKTRFVALEQGYHGDTVGAMSVGYLESFFGSYRPLLFQVIQIPNPFGLQGRRRNGGEAAAICLKSIETVLKEQSSKCAAVIMESGAQVAGGAVIYPMGFQHAVSELCDQYDALLIVDEIATGFGRLGNFIEYVGQRSDPDIVSFGKALTAGYFPLAATLATQEVFDTFNGDFFEGRQFYHGHTFAGHSVGCASAVANFDMYEDRNLIRHIRKTSHHLEKRLDEFKEYSIVSDIRHSGLLVGIELARDGKALSRLANGQPVNYFIMKEAQKLGVFMRPLANIIMFVPPLAMGIAELDRLINVGLSLTKRIEVSC
jgi:adenosylmethionine-8-amino-7-oxononanoate aminotransferase